ncbi:hypothetical protein FACS189429_2270 [Bacteroidia bacterium]|nr:hypothetical protein FACS189429_2270 [Bacteroidia bacterium]GHV44975.1 hypothetical protein FACS1894180_6980 [Bacteroidia bacterium]
MKNNKFYIKIAIMLFCTMSIHNIYGQESINVVHTPIGVYTTMQMLTAKTWVFTVPSGYSLEFSYKLTYTTTEEIGTISYNGGGGSGTRSYYLSNTIETVFDNSKVGNVQNGKYLIVATKGTNFEVFEILTLNAIRFSFKHLQSGTISNFSALVLIPPAVRR